METVNHPSHYQSKNGLEAIDVIEAFCDGLNGLEAFCTGNVLKYMCRWKNKNGIEDVKKAKWYIDKLIMYFEKNNMVEGSDIVCTTDDIIIDGKSIKETFMDLENKKENK